MNLETERKKIARYFARKATESAEDAGFMFRHYPKETLGYEKGKVYVAIADVYSKLAVAFSEPISSQETQ